MGWFDDFVAAEKNPVRLMWDALPPNVRDQYASGARSLATLAGELSPGAAFRDAGEESVRMMDAVREGNWMDAAAGPAKMATAMAGIVPIAKGAKAIRAYHGSPHSFDKFDASKIGTGEGAQAYGHGLYFAENEGVAKNYRAMLATPTTPEQVAHQYLNAHGGDQAKALRALQDHAQGGMGWSAEEMARIRAAVPILKGGDVGAIKPAGHMYEVGIHADPAKMLDWDKPLSGQPEAVRGALTDVHERLQRNWEKYPSLRGQEPAGGGIYESSILHGGEYFDKAAASQALLQRGIPGIKYLDQGSRTQGAGSSNYVVFDPAIIEILRKYGLLPATVAAGVGGASMLPANDTPPGGLF